MELSEYKFARLNRLPVMGDGIRYDYVNGLRLWYSETYKEWVYSIECVQNGGKTVVSMPINDVDVIYENSIIKSSEYIKKLGKDIFFEEGGGESEKVQYT